MTFGMYWMQQELTSSIVANQLPLAVHIIWRTTSTSDKPVHLLVARHCGDIGVGATFVFGRVCEVFDINIVHQSGVLFRDVTNVS